MGLISNIVFDYRNIRLCRNFEEQNAICFQMTPLCMMLMMALKVSL